jgi:hypothetical protein
MRTLSKLKLYEEFVGEPTINYSYIKSKIYLGHEEHFRVSSVEEGMDFIEKKIYDVLGVSEKKIN